MRAGSGARPERRLSRIHIYGAGLSGERNSSRSDERLPESGEHRQIGVERDSFQATKDSPEQVKLTLSDGTTFEVPAPVRELTQRVTVRRKVREVIEPLRREGVEELEITTTTEATSAPTLVVQEEDAPAIEASTLDSANVLTDELRTLWLLVGGPSFEGRKWRVSEGAGRAYSVSIEDEVFLAAVDANEERFGKGDMLHCRMRVIQTSRPEGGIKTDYYVIEVMEHVPSHTQPRLWESPDG